MERFDHSHGPHLTRHGADSEMRHEEPEDVMDPRFDDPLSPDYVGPSQDFSEAGFREVIEALEAPPPDTPERRATFARAREMRPLILRALANARVKTQ